MGHILTLEIPNSLYESLRVAAEKHGTTPEAIAAQRLVERSAEDDDPLLRLAGVVRSNSKDVAELHDAYIGTALADEVNRVGQS